MPSRKSTGEAAATHHRRLVTRIGIEVRQMGAQSVVISQIVAARFGLHTTDLECLDLIAMRRQVSAGELAAATGLTSGATTALIDRLAKAGYVERVADAVDRRRVHVRIRPQTIKPIEAVYLPMQKRMFALWSSYSARDLEVIADFLWRSRELAVQCADDIQRHAPCPAVRRTKRRGQQEPA